MIHWAMLAFVASSTAVESHCQTWLDYYKVEELVQQVKTKNSILTLNSRASISKSVHAALAVLQMQTVALQRSSLAFAINTHKEIQLDTWAYQATLRRCLGLLVLCLLVEERATSFHLVGLLEEVAAYQTISPYQQLFPKWIGKLPQNDPTKKMLISKLLPMKPWQLVVSPLLYLLSVRSLQSWISQSETSKVAASTTQPSSQQKRIVLNLWNILGKAVSIMKWHGATGNTFCSTQDHTVLKTKQKQRRWKNTSKVSNPMVILSMVSEDYCWGKQ